MRLKRLLEALEITDGQADALRRMRLEAAARELWYVAAMTAHRRPPYHGVNHRATARRRAANKRARVARRHTRR